MDLGLHLANFTWTGGPAELGSTLARTARDAEAAGVARLTVMDHFWQIRGVGPAEHDMLEAYTALGFLAAATERVLLHTLVTGVTYREPGLLAKAVTTLDVLSGGRAGLGIGAAWNEDESIGLGFPFPPLKERFERLEEAIRVSLQMWSDDEGAFEGEHYRLGRTLNSPQALTKPHPYLMIGGSGERKTLRLVAQYADACNLFPTPEVQHKLDVLQRHCDDIGRDSSEIERTTLGSITPDTTRDALLTDLQRFSELGFQAVYLMPNVPEPARAVELVGSVVEEAAGF